MPALLTEQVLIQSYRNSQAVISLLLKRFPVLRIPKPPSYLEGLAEGILIQVIQKYVGSYNDYSQKTFGYEVSLGDADPEELKTALPKIYNRFEQGDGFGFLYMLFNDDVEHVMKAVRVNDSPMASAKDCDCVAAMINFQSSERALKTCWNQIFADTDMCSFDQIGKNVLNYVGNVSYRVKELLTWGEKEQVTLLELMDNVGFNKEVLPSLSVEKALPSNVICSHIAEAANSGVCLFCGNSHMTCSVR